MISFISSFAIIDVVIPDSNIFLLIVAPVADATAVNPNGIKTLLAFKFNLNFSLKAIQLLVMVLKVYLKTFLVALFYATVF